MLRCCVALLSSVVAVAIATPAYAAPKAVTEAPPSETCPDYGVGFYGFTGGYCLDKNKEGVSYLSVSPHTARAGETVTLTLYTDEGRGYAAQDTAIFPPVHWNCGPDQQVSCSDTPFATYGPIIRQADPEVTGASTESNPIVLFDSIDCPGSAGQCQEGWLKNLNGEGRTVSYTKQIKITSAVPDDRDRWLVLGSGNEAEDYFAVLSDVPCVFKDTNKNKVDDCRVTSDLKAQLQKLSKLVDALKSTSTKKTINAVKSFLKSVNTQITTKGDEIDTQDGLPIAAKVTAVGKAVAKAVKVTSRTFKADKSKAKKSIQTLIAALAISRNGTN